MGAATAKNLRLFTLRKEKQLTQSQVADLLKMHINVYARIEEGKKPGRIKDWDRIQEFYKIPDGEMWEVVKGKTRR